MARRPTITAPQPEPRTVAERLRFHADVLMHLPASEQMIGARDSVIYRALREIAGWIEQHDRQNSADLDTPKSDRGESESPRK